MVASVPTGHAGQPDDSVFDRRNTRTGADMKKTGKLRRKACGSIRHLFCICSSALVLMLAFTAVPVLAQDDADYPDHVKDEIRAAKLEREARLIKLEFELQSLRDSILDAKIRKFENARTLLQAEQEMRDLLDEHPDLYSLYETALGQDAGPPPEIPESDVPEMPVYSVQEVNFCGCLYTVRVLWMGQNEQTGQAVLALGDSMYEVHAGGKIGGSLCIMREADGEHAILECRHPVQNAILRHSIALKKFHRVKAGESASDGKR